MVSLPCLYLLIASQSVASTGDALQALESIAGHLCVVVARRDLGVSSPVAGVLANVDVNLGERVRRGQTLFRLDEAELRQDVAVAHAMVRSAAADVERARVAHEQAKLRYERRRGTDGVYSLEEVDAARAQAEIALADLQAAEARVSEQQSRLALLEAHLSKVRVVAPFDGIIAARFQQPGSTLQPGVLVVRLIDDSAPLLRFAVPPMEAPRYSLGADVEVTLAGREEPVHARIIGMAPAVDPAIDMVPVEAELMVQDTGAGDVRVGTVGRVRLRGDSVVRK